MGSISYENSRILEKQKKIYILKSDIIYEIIQCAHIKYIIQK